jgi:hypothetical protein
MREGISRAIKMQLESASEGCGFIPDYTKDISIVNTALSSKSLIDNAIKALATLLAKGEGNAT